MKEAAPRIFRSLEQSKGSADFDRIVAAAIAAYGSLKAPSEAQARDFARLVAPLWDRIGPDTRRAVAASLSHATRVPRNIVELLLKAPVEISAPFLVSSPVLSDADLASLGDDPRMRRIVESRVARAPSLASSAETGSAPTGHRLIVDAPPMADDSLGAFPPPPVDPVAATREILRRLATTGHRRAEKRLDRKEVLASLFADARARHGEAFYASLARHLSLGAERARAIAQAPDGVELAAALKALGMPDADALSVLMLMKPAVGLHVDAFDAMTEIYRSLDADGCVRSFDGFAGPTEQPERTERRSDPREPARSTFGRRKVRPAGEEDQRKRS